MSDPSVREPWHLERKVPIALILTLVIQTAGMVWWAASLSAAQADHRRRIGILEATDLRVAAEAQRMSETLARLDERIQAQTRILQRIEESVARPPR